MTFISACMFPHGWRLTALPNMFPLYLTHGLLNYLRTYLRSGRLQPIFHRPFLHYPYPYPKPPGYLNCRANFAQSHLPDPSGQRLGVNSKLLTDTLLYPGILDMQPQINNGKVF